MDFQNRIKKEMTEGVVRAILVDAGYRVIGLGIENVVRETECLTALEYAGLDFPKTMRSLPDLLVMNREQNEKYLVEVKFRANWSSGIFDEISEQVHLFKEVILIYVNSNPVLVKDNPPTPAAFFRCCKVRSNGGKLEAYLNQHGEKNWVPQENITSEPKLWWQLSSIQNVFIKVEEAKEQKTLMKAVEVLKGILNA